MPKQYERSYATVELTRNSSSSPRVPDHVKQRVVLSEKLHEYIEDRLHSGKKIVLDVAAFLSSDVETGDETCTVVLSVPYQLAGPKTFMADSFERTSGRAWNQSK